MIFIRNEEFEGQFEGRFGHPVFSTDSSFRFKANTTTTFPTFSINVRDGHWKQSDNAVPLRKSGKLRGTGILITEQDSNTYKEGHQEDDLEFDLDIASYFSIETMSQLPGEIEKRMDGVNLSVSSSKTRFGVLMYKSKEMSDAQPVRVYGQANDFRADSPQREFFSAVRRRPTAFIVVCKLESNQGALTWEAYKWLANDVRTLSASRPPMNDWNFARCDDYSETRKFPFSRFASNPAIELPVADWLRRDGDDGVSSIYPKSADQKVRQPARKAYASLKLYVSHFGAALLDERDQDYREMKAIYNPSRKHTVRIVKTGSLDADDHPIWHLHVRLNTRGLAGTRVKPWHENRTSVTLEVGQSKHTFDGEVSYPPLPGFDFVIEARAMQQLDRIFHEAQDYPALIDPTYENVAIKRKLDDLAQLANNGFTTSQVADDLQRVNSRARGLFELSSIISEPSLDILSSDFTHRTFEAEEQRELDRVDRYSQDKLKQQQRQFLDACTTQGVRANVAILEGLPGIGNTGTLALLIGKLAICGAKVIGTAHSNEATNALYSSVLDVLKDQQLDQLISKVVRVYSTKRKKYYRRMITGQSPRMLEVPQDCFSRKIYEYVQANPTDVDSKDFLGLDSADQEEQIGPCKGRKMGAIVESLRKKVLADVLLVFGTTWVASTLDKLGFNAEACILDEAAQLSEPDAVVVLHNQRKLNLVVFAGDEIQLPPVVKSLQSGTSPYANVLSLSMMTRLMIGYPRIFKITLTLNYRSHRSLVAMPSAIYYDGRMVSANIPRNNNTALHRGVRSFFMSNRLPNGAQLWNHDQRELFFDVPSLSEHEENGTSLTNRAGINAIIQFIGWLLKAGVDGKDIGVISAYKHDVILLQQQLDTMCGGNATVDSFQGRQKKIIIMHFVNASQDPKNPLGHLVDACRLCVATTRAQEYQFFFGNMSHWLRRRPTARSVRTRTVYELVDWLVQNEQVVRWSHVRKN